MTTATGRERPWRAVAYVPDPTGQTEAGRKRIVAGRTSAKTQAGLARFISKHLDAGNVVSTEYVEPLPLEGQ